jgi:choline dehydrogenase
MIPYFNRLETYDTSTPVPDLWSNNPPSSKRGSDGPLNTMVGNSVTSPVAEDFITSSLAAGIPLASLGFNDPEPNKRIGVSYYEFNIRNRLRDSAAKAILSPDDKNIPFPKNLIIKTDATVEKILFDECEKDTVEDESVEMPCLPKSAGVRYYSSETGTVTDVKLRRPSEKKLTEKIERDTEVILAAGAVLTPQLLANSGIHDNGDLVDLKGVGRNLQDHPVVGVVFQAKENLSESIESYFNMDADGKEAFHSYLNSMTDFMSSGKSDNMSENAKIYGTPGFAVGAFLRSPHSVENDHEAPEDRSPDIQLTFFPHTIEPHFTQQYDLTRPNKIDFILITVALLKPEARYHLDLHHHASKPEDHSTPKIAQTARDIFEKKYRFKVPDILGGELTKRDLQRLAWGVDQVRNIMSSEPISNNIGYETYPGTGYQDANLELFIDHHIMRNSHWSGSSKMGRKDDKDAVVDSELRVHGVKNLRIVDAGVMPFIPNGNTHSTTCAISLRSVDLLFQ